MTVELHRLPNGVRVVTEHMPGLQSASLGVWVMAGGRHERAEQNGVAHFLEHMAFKGTKTRDALQIAEAIEDVGGYINAYTSREMTAYFARVLENGCRRRPIRPRRWGVRSWGPRVGSNGSTGVIWQGSWANATCRAI